MSRILLITTEYPPATGGIGTYCAQIAAAAAANGHEVTVLAPDYGRSHDDPSKRARRPSSATPGRTYTVEASRASHPDQPARRPQALRHHSCDRLAVGLVLGLHQPVSPSALPGDRARHRDPADAGLAADQAAGRQLLLGAGHHPDQQPLHQVAAAREVPGGRSGPGEGHTAGVGEYWFEPAENPEAVLARYGVPTDRTCLLTVGRLDERKGHRLVFKALSQLPPRGRREDRLRGRRGAGARSTPPSFGVSPTSVPVPTVFTGAVANDDLRALYASSAAVLHAGRASPAAGRGFRSRVPRGRCAGSRRHRVASRRDSRGRGRW